jgi:hypothetical protein
MRRSIFIRNPVFIGTFHPRGRALARAALVCRIAHIEINDEMGEAA